MTTRFKIFIDMDGVLTDFNTRYTTLFGQTPNTTKSQSKKIYNTQWNTFVSSKQFATLDILPLGIQILQYVNTLDNTQISILTSAGGFERHREVQQQKLQWLDNHNIQYPAITVPGRKYKAGFATPDSIILDDTLDTTIDFTKAGGQAIHINKDTTIQLISDTISSTILSRSSDR